MRLFGVLSYAWAITAAALIAALLTCANDVRRRRSQKRFKPW